MHTNHSLFGIACRAAAFGFVLAGTASLAHAQQFPSVASTFKTPIFLASESSPADLALTSSSSSSSSSSSADALAADKFGSGAAAFAGSQPPPRRRYGRPNYSDSHNNPDGSEKWTFVGAFGLGLPIGDTHRYETDGYGIQAGVGRNFNKTVGVIAQFDYDHFGLQGKTISNQQYLYNYYCTPALQTSGACAPVTGLDGNNHVWSFTLNPTFTVPTEGSLGAYAVVGVGFYHKVTNFTLPSNVCLDYYCFYQATVQQNVDHYTSNAPGVSGGFGLTWKFSQFSNERLFVEGRYVLMLNSQRYGITATSSATTLNTYNGNNAYPANSNRTTYIPIKFGIRF